MALLGRPPVPGQGQPLPALVLDPLLVDPAAQVLGLPVALLPGPEQGLQGLLRLPIRPELAAGQKVGLSRRLLPARRGGRRRRGRFLLRRCLRLLPGLLGALGRAVREDLLQVLRQGKGLNGRVDLLRTEGLLRQLRRWALVPARQ